MSKFKVGDKIVLKKDIEGIDACGIGKRQIDNSKGKIRTVAKIDISDDQGRDIICLKDNPLFWNAEMFELAKAKDDLKGNFKAKCIKSFSGITTKGKVYEIVNGKIAFDDGNRSVRSYESVEELNKGMYSKFELVKDTPTITIYTKGNETIASLKQGKEVVKTAKAKCNPSDEFKFEIGAKLAFERLLGVEFGKAGEKKNDGNFKARCISTKDCSLTVGKVYEFVDGYSKWDRGTKMPQFEYKGINRFSSFKDLETWFSKSSSKFEEVKEEAIKEEPVQESTAPFDWESFKQGKIAIHCDTEEKAKTFLQQCDEIGIRWYGGETATKNTRFCDCKEETAYCCFSQSGIEYSEVEFYKSENIDIYEYQLPYKEVQRKAKVGEFVKVVNTSAVPVTNGKPEYKDGDILEIISNDYHARYAEGVADDGKDRVLLSKEYVVLEGYEPKKPPVKEESTVKEVERHGKVGEYIKLTQDVHEHKVGSILKVGKSAKRLSGKDCGVYVTLSGGTTSSCICNSKYVVLENYQPTEPKQDTSIKVGDTVEVINSGNQYPVYSDWFKDYAPDFSLKFAYSKSVGNGFNGKVVAKHLHENNVDMLYAIQNDAWSNDEVYLFGEKGIKKVTNP